MFYPEIHWKAKSGTSEEKINNKKQQQAFGFSYINLLKCAAAVSYFANNEFFDNIPFNNPSMEKFSLISSGVNMLIHIILHYTAGMILKN